MHHPTHKLLRAAYSFYNVSGATPWVDLMQDALVVAKNVSAFGVCVCLFWGGGGANFFDASSHWALHMLTIYNELT